MRTRVVLAIESAPQRALARLGLDMSGDFEVVGVAVDEGDLPFVLATLRPDVAVVDLPSAPTRSGGEIIATGDASTHVVLFDELLARHRARTATSARPRPVELAPLLRAALGGRHAPAAAVSQ